MKKLFHNYWQVVVVAFFTIVLALQIPRRALLFAPQKYVSPAVYASFITIDPQVYSNMIDKVRMSWQQRARSAGRGLDSRVGEFDFEDPLPPPEYLARESRVPCLPTSINVEAFVPSVALLPPTMAYSHGTRLPAFTVQSTADPRKSDLLEWPDSLKEETLP